MMTSRDHERSWSWPRYVWCPLSRKWLEIATWWQWSPVIGNCNVIVTPIVTPIGNGHLYYRAHSWRLYICSCRCSCMSRTLRSTKSEDMYRDHTYKYDCLNNGPEPLQKILTQHDSLKNEWTYVYTRQWTNDYTRMKPAFTYLIQQEDTRQMVAATSGAPG